MKTSIALLVPFGALLLVACTGASGDGDVVAPSLDASAETATDAHLADTRPSDTNDAHTTTSHPSDDASTTTDSAVDSGIDTTSPPDTTPTFPDAAGVTIDLSTVTVLNSPADVASWPETAKITTLDLGPTGVYIDFTKRDGAGSWPDVPFGAPGDSLEYTLWIVIQVEGKWYTSGCIQYWRGLDRNGGPPSGYAANWYYDAIRWAPMTGHQPLPGEPVGFFVTAGNERNVTDDSCCAVKERSNLVVIPFPSTDSGTVFSY